MQWPTKHNCHVREFTFQRFHPGATEAEWRPPRVEALVEEPPREGKNFSTFSTHDQPFRTCSYCGSIHLEDLYNLMLKHPIKLDVADWKYGWPHKAYVEGIPSSLRGQKVCRSSRSTWEDGQQKYEPVFSIEPENATAWAKAYFVHLTDEGFDDEAFNAITEEIRKRTGILFSKAERPGDLRYRTHQWDPMP